VDKDGAHPSRKCRRLLARVSSELRARKHKAVKPQDATSCVLSDETRCIKCNEHGARNVSNV
jgi:hypothetical protein